MHEKTVTHLTRRKPGYTLDRTFYTDAEIYQDDLEEIFFKEWLFVTPACELPQAGNYVTYNIADYRIVVVRGQDGEVRAFHNTCRHRGSVICREAKGSAAKLVCPYHQWTYELDGSLLWTRDMGEDFDPTQHGLKQIHCRNLSGLIYICLADDAPEFDSFAEALHPYIAPHDLENAKVAHVSRIVENGNWKLVWENNRECYHCSANHPSLIRTFPEDPRVSFLGEGDAPAYISEHFEACEAAGLAAEFKVPADGQYRLSRMPLVPGTKSFTMDGALAVPNKRLGTVEWDYAGVCNKFHYPSTWAYFLPDHSMTFRVTPISPTETELVTSWLVHKDAVEGVDYDLKHLTEVWEATNDEDRRVVEDNQLGVNSPAFEPGPYSPAHEVSVDAFVDWYCNRLATRMASLRSAAE
ncbi:aromatic ring-hydroxylating oxygenase subunit alpha [Celeribacter halophilus]|uniref:aromatic ring-hydroxylating oxygenase subunit alpha n=1 Tax=Celeribacter halophilus TaxID=576117 RepID=UPI001C093930|nr:aromatic ring-hydroxylating dioxygenase subunit alpha [Celeribacter halophilus]MBU2889908.1 aromatic ring-hydroxylating dioxygenase subunit alpha [Celeribacter halophilus]MDO6512197.1 aromatic ring-hydroxylating dioxygenase subunit alpha [Celeribacter halophilus]